MTDMVEVIYMENNKTDRTQGRYTERTCRENDRQKSRENEEKNDRQNRRYGIENMQGR